MSKFDDFVTAYFECALWSSTDNSNPETGGDPLDDNYDQSNITVETAAEMIKDCQNYWTEHRAICARNPSLAGHDFWLTRNRHGAGWWDGDWPEEIGRAMTEASHAYGEYNLYVGDDGKIHGS